MSRRCYRIGASEYASESGRVGRPVRCGELKKGMGSAPAWVRKKRGEKPLFFRTLNYTYSRTALYQELDELCRLVEKFKHRGLL